MRCWLVKESLLLRHRVKAQRGLTPAAPSGVCWRIRKVLTGGAAGEFGRPVYNPGNSQAFLCPGNHPRSG
jgi:hypothetical protein